MLIVLTVFTSLHYFLSFFHLYFVRIRSLNTVMLTESFYLLSITRVFGWWMRARMQPAVEENRKIWTWTPFAVWKVLGEERRKEEEKEKMATIPWLSWLPHGTDTELVYTSQAYWTRTQGWADLFNIRTAWRQDAYKSVQGVRILLKSAVLYSGVREFGDWWHKRCPRDCSRKFYLHHLAATKKASLDITRIPNPA